MAIRPSALRVVAVLNAAVLVCALGLAGAVSVAGTESRPAVASMALDGFARISDPDGRRLVSGEDHRLLAGDVVDLLGGEALVRLPGGGSLELRALPEPGTARLALAEVPTLLAGDALVVAPSGTPVMLDAGGARFVITDGAGRVSRSTGTTFAVYEGEATLSSGGRELQGGLAALRQVVVPAPGKLPLRSSPLSFGVVPDPWDRRYLGGLIDLQAALERRSIGFTTSLRDDVAPDRSFFQTVLPALLEEPAFDQELLEGQRRPVGETLIGAAVALVGNGGGFVDRWREVFQSREQGTGWGVVALDQGASRDALMATLDEAVDRSPLAFARPAPIPRVEATEPPPAVPRPISPVPSPPSAPGASPLPPPPSAPPVPAPAVSEPESIVEVAADPLAILLDDVLAGLDDLGGGLL